MISRSCDLIAPSLAAMYRRTSIVQVIDIAKGKNSIEVNDGSHLISVLETLKVAVETGELDAQVSGAAEVVKARFAK